ncbi:hypothetical protein [Proteus mirabilis]|uniref:hypothetical protein n=1 Tax=Proteus mirabilis TaxID=584 RepID=UPI0034D5981E
MSPISLFIDDKKTTFPDSKTALMRLANLRDIKAIRFNQTTSMNIQFNFETGIITHHSVGNGLLIAAEVLLSTLTFNCLQSRLSDTRVYTSYNTYNNSKYTEYFLCDGYIKRKDTISKEINTNTFREYSTGREVNFNIFSKNKENLISFQDWLVANSKNNINFYGINNNKILSLGSSRFDIHQLNEEFFGIHYVQIKCPNTSSKKYKLIAIAFGYGYDLDEEVSFDNIDEILTDNQSIEKIYKLESNNIYANLQLLTTRTKNIPLIRDINITYNLPGYMSFVFSSESDKDGKTMTRVTLNQHTGVSLELLSQKYSDGVVKFFMN